MMPTFKGYDEWKLRGPDEDRPEPEYKDCEDCVDGIATDAGGSYTCEECGGSGEIEVTQEEPDGDYEYERRLDEKL
jgi:DnaJ-class molecular chaperone